MGEFRFKQFSVRQEDSALKVGTDAVLLGAAMTLLPEDRNLLDVGTGTGVIALMAAQRSSAMIDAIDTDMPSVAEAGVNFTLSPWAGRLHAIHADLKSFVPEVKYDLVFSNPPYFENSLKNPDVRESFARHTDNLSYRDICLFASRYLSPGGRLSLILPSEREAPLIRTAASFGLYPFRLLRIRTAPGKSPKRIVAEFSLNRGPVEENELTLRDGSERSAEYLSLTGDFYL
ncbi:MAG: methyltransferase [Bacteroidales bacterium]|nr:methyltransferase [Bacteroidales bacterium]